MFVSWLSSGGGWRRARGRLRRLQLMVLLVVLSVLQWSPTEAVATGPLLAQGSRAGAVGRLAPPGTPITGSPASVGYLPGGWEVASDGSFTYNIPLDVPPGRAGMAPPLSLEYSANGGDGPLGVGWTISGAGSRITRCPKNHAVEGRAEGVRYETTDAFCLDGMKLIPVIGQYGQSGTRYRTETDVFSEVISGVATNLGPASFTVRTKDGRVRTYEVRQAQRTLLAVTRRNQSQGEPTFETGNFGTATLRLFWLMTSESDRSGNTIRYEYEDLSKPDQADKPAEIDNEFQLRRIVYTSHGSETGRRWVELLYEDRPDVTSGYVTGVKFTASKRVKTIRMFAPNPATSSLAWEYRLGYAYSGANRSLLTSITKCGPSGGCLRSKLFRWDAQERPFVPSFTKLDRGLAPVATNNGAPPIMRVGDVDFDGSDDAVISFGGQASAAEPVLVMSNRDLTGAVNPLSYRRLNTLPPLTSMAHSRFSDLEGDGRLEFWAHMPVGTGSVGQALRWNPQTGVFETIGNGGALVASPTPVDFVDFDGDGRLDYVSADVPRAPSNQVPTPPSGEPPPVTHFYSVRMNTGSGFGPPRTSTMIALGSAPIPVQPGDVDGDGRGELLIGSGAAKLDELGQLVMQQAIINYDGQHWFKQAPVRGWAATASNAKWVDKYHTVSGDFNGDSLSDYLLLTGDMNTVPRLAWNTGNGLAFDDKFAQRSPFPQDKYIDAVANDVNGDGRDDVVIFHHPDSGAGTTVMLSLGDGRFQRAGLDLLAGALDDRVGRATSRLGDFNGDGRTDIARISGGRLEVLLQNPSFGHRIVAVQDQSTAWPRETVQYSTQWNDHPHRAQTPCTYPQRCLKRGLMVARQVDTRVDLVDPVIAAGTTMPKPARSYLYAYDDLRVDARGRGQLGFGVKWEWDPARGAETETIYDNRTMVDGRYYPNAGRPKQVTTTVPILTQAQTDMPLAQRPATPTARVARTTYNYETRRLNGGKTYAILPSSSGVKEWEQQVTMAWRDSLVGAGSATRVSGIVEPFIPMRGTVSSTNYDDYGNKILSRTTTMVGVTEEVVTTYDNRVADWLISLPTKTRTTRSEYDGTPAPVTRTTDSHFDALGRLDIMYTERDSANLDLRSTISHELNVYGLPRTTTVSTPGLATQTFRYDYAPAFLGQPDEKISISRTSTDNPNPALASWEETAVHPAYGVTVATRDANGVQSNAWFDDMGRPVRTEQSGQAPVLTSYTNRVDKSGGSNGTVVMTTAAARRSEDIVGPAGRTISQAQSGFDGVMRATTTSYDRLGRVAAIAAPAPTGTTVYGYDSLDRLTVTVAPDGKRTTSTHAFGSASTVDPGGTRTDVVFDVNGRKLTSSEFLSTATGGRPQELVTRYTYGPFDTTHTVTDPKGNITSYAYDTLGRVTTMVDPDRGTTTNQYYGTGQLRTSTRAAVGTTVYSYDGNGRLVTTTGPDGPTQYGYDTAANGLGKPSFTLSPDGIRTEYRYTVHGQDDGVDIIDKNANATYSTKQTYDNLGRAATLAYPQVAGQPRFTVSYGYNANGHLESVSDATNPAAPKRLWTVSSRNADQSLKTGVLGNGSSAASIANGYLPAGRLQTRTATVGAAKVQDLTYGYYDNGLVRTRADATNARTETFGYDSLHRLTGWTLQLGSTAGNTTGYGYDTIDNLTTVTRNGAVVETRTHGKPGGVQPHTLTGITAGGVTQNPVHDVAGRQTSGNGRATAYTTFDLPRSITRNGVTTTYAYDGDGRKIKETAGTRSTTYLPGLYERRRNGATDTHVFHLSSPDGPIGQAVHTAGTTTMEYTLTDHLGSVTTTIGSTGVVGQNLFYEPFGMPIKRDGSPAPELPAGNLTSGFTGHEHTREVGLINMNGRLYDPAHKVFQSSDPLNTPGHNPYSYVHHSPLNRVDPSGFVDAEIFRRWKDGRTQEEFDEFVAAGEAYQEGGTAGLAQHQKGALGRGVENYNWAVDTEATYAEANRRAQAQASGGGHMEYAAGSYRNSAAFAELKAEYDAMKEEERAHWLAELDGIGFDESSATADVSTEDRLIAGAIGFGSLAAVFAGAEMVVGAMALCAENVPACFAAINVAVGVANQGPGVPSMPALAVAKGAQAAAPQVSSAANSGVKVVTQIADDLIDDVVEKGSRNSGLMFEWAEEMGPLGDRAAGMTTSQMDAGMVVRGGKVVQDFAQKARESSPLFGEMMADNPSCFVGDEVLGSMRFLIRAQEKAVGKK